MMVNGENTYNRPLYYPHKSSIADILISEGYHDLREIKNGIVNTSKGLLNGTIVKKKSLENQRPLYVDINSSIYDIVSSERYHDLKEFFNNLRNSSIDMYQGTMHAIKNSKKITGPYAIATVFSLAFNYFVTGEAHNQGHSQSVLNWYSYGSEKAVIGPVFAAVYIYNSVTKDNKKFVKAVKDFALQVFPITLVISLVPYRIARGELTEMLLKTDMAPNLAAIVSQATLLVPLGLTMDYCVNKSKQIMNSPHGVKATLKGYYVITRNNVKEFLKDEEYKTEKPSLERMIVKNDLDKTEPESNKKETLDDLIT